MRDERGSGLIDLAWTTLILLVPIVYVVVALFDVQRGAFATGAAARAAGRAYVLAPTDVAGQARALAAARQALADQGQPTDGLRVEVTCTPDPRRCHQGGSVVTVVVRTRADLPLLPRILGREPASVGLAATHREPVGQYHPVSP